MLGFTETGQVGVNDGDDRALVAEVDLDLAEVFAPFKHMGGVGMAQGVNVGGLSNTAGQESQAEGALERAAAHGLGGGGGALAAVAFGRKDELGVAMGFPLFAQQHQGALGQGNVAIAGRRSKSG